MRKKEESIETADRTEKRKRVERQPTEWRRRRGVFFIGTLSPKFLSCGQKMPLAATLVAGRGTRFHRKTAPGGERVQYKLSYLSLTTSHACDFSQQKSTRETIKEVCTKYCSIVTIVTEHIHSTPCQRVPTSFQRSQHTNTMRFVRLTPCNGFPFFLYRVPSGKEFFT